MCPVYPLDGFYSPSYENNLDKIASEVYNKIKECMQEVNNNYSIEEKVKERDYNKLKDKIFIKIISIERNEELLKTLIYKETSGVAMIPYVVFATLEGGDMYNANISYDLFNSFENKPTIDDLFAVALLNTKKQGFIFNLLLDNVHNDKFIDFSPINFLSLINKTGLNIEGFIIVTNKNNSFGSSFVLFTEYLNVIANILDSNLYILPSSIDEVLIMPENNSQVNTDELIAIVRDINKMPDVVTDINVLGDFIWLYDKETTELKYIT